MKLGKCPKVQNFLLNAPLPQGFEIELIFGLRAVVSEIRQIFKIAILGHEIW